jgi:hypothetical protein
MNDTVAGVLLISVGLLSILGAALNWRIIMRPGKLFNRLVGEKVARPTYVAVGVVLLILGIGQLVGMIG